MSKHVPLAPSRRQRKASDPMSRDESETMRQDKAIRSSTETLKPFASVELMDISLKENLRIIDYPGGKSPMDLLLEAEQSNWLDFTDTSLKEGSEIGLAEDFRRAELTQRAEGSCMPLTSKAGTYKRTRVDETLTRMKPMTSVHSDSRFLELLGNNNITFTENHENDMYSELGRSGIKPALKRTNSLSLVEEPISQDMQRSSTFSSSFKPSFQDTFVAASNKTSAINAPNIGVTLNTVEGSLVNLFEPAEETPAELRDENMVKSDTLLDIQSSCAKLLSDEISEDEMNGDMFCVEVMDNEVSKRCNLSGHYTLNVTFEGLALFNEDGPLFCWLYNELEGFGFVEERDIFRFKSICSSQSGKGMFCFLTEEAEKINKSVTAHATPNCQLKVKRNSDHKSHSNVMALVMKNLKKIRITNLKFMKKRNKISVSVINEANSMPLTDVNRERKHQSPLSDSTHQYEEMGHSLETK